MSGDPALTPGGGDVDRLGGRLPAAHSAIDWRTAQIYYYEKDKDALLLDCLRPLLAELETQGATGQHLERHWQGGPHVRLHFRSPNPEAQAASGRLIEDRVLDYLRREPSQRRIVPEQMHRSSALLAQFEGLTAAPLQPDNSLRLVPYSVDDRRWPSEHLLRLVRDYLHDGLPLVFRLIETSRGNPAERVRLGMLIVLLYARTLGGLRTGYRFARGYIEKYVAFSETDRQTAIRSGLRDGYARKRTAMLRLIRKVDSGAELGDDEWIREAWQEQHDAYRARILSLLESGVKLAFTREEVLAVYSDPATPRLHSSPSGGPTTDNDDARRYEPSEYWKQHITEHEFIVHVVLVNLLYRTLDLLGITVAEKIVLLALISEGVEEVHDIRGSWQRSGGDVAERA